MIIDPIIFFFFQNDDVLEETSTRGQSEDEFDESEVIISSAEGDVNNEINDENRSNSPIENVENEAAEETEQIDNSSKTNENEDVDMEIIHHDMTEAEKNDDEITEEIHPQGLPIENKQTLKNVSSKKLNDAANR